MAETRPYTTPQFPAFRMREGRPHKSVPRWAVIGIFLILAAGFVIEARSFLMPVTLAFLLFFVFVPFRRLMARIGIGPAGTAGIVTLGMIALVVVLGYIISGPISQVMANSGRIAQRLEQRFEEIHESIRPIEEAAAKLDAISGGGEPDVAVSAGGPAPATVVTGKDSTAVVQTPNGDAPEQITVEVTADAEAAPTTMERLATLGPAIGGQVVFTLVLLYFMLASGDLLYLKIVQSFDSMGDKRAAYSALRDIEDKLGAYLGTVTLINAGLGVAIGVAMWAWGMPSPVLWAVAGFVLNYIPYIGAITGTVTGILVALFVFDGLWQPILVGLTFMALTSIEGQFVTPVFVSRRLQMNEVVVFLNVALWAWFWSVLGMVVAVPMLVVLRVLAEHVPALEKFGNFLAGDRPPALVNEAEDAAIADSPDEADAREILDVGEEAPDAAEAGRRTADVASASGAQDAPRADPSAPSAIVVAPAGKGAAD